MAAFLALISSLSWGTGDFIGGITSKKVSSFLVVTVNQMVGLVLMVIAATITGAWGTPPDYVGWAVLAAVSGASGLVVFYRALATGTMGVVAPISALAGLIPLSAGILDGDRFTLVAGLGAALIGIGVVLASGPELTGGAGKTLAMAVFAAVMFGIALLAIARGSETSAIMTMGVMRLAQVLVLVPVVLVGLQQGRLSSAGLRPLLPILAVSGFLDVFANLTFGWAADIGSLAVVAVLGSLYPVVTAVLAAVFLHERLRAVQYIGVAAALGGLALMNIG